MNKIGYLPENIEYFQICENVFGGHFIMCRADDWFEIKYLWHDLTVHDVLYSLPPTNRYEEGFFKTEEQAKLVLKQYQIKQSQEERRNLHQNELRLCKEVDELRHKIKESQKID